MDKEEKVGMMDRCMQFIQKISEQEKKGD